MGKLKIDYSNMPKGTKIMIPDFPGDFENGNEYEVPQLDEDLVLSDSPVKSKGVAKKAKPAEIGDD